MKNSIEFLEHIAEHLREEVDGPVGEVAREWLREVEHEIGVVESYECEGADCVGCDIKMTTEEMIQRLESTKLVLVGEMKRLKSVLYVAHMGVAGIMAKHIDHTAVQSAHDLTSMFAHYWETASEWVHCQSELSNINRELEVLEGGQA